MQWDDIRQPCFETHRRAKRRSLDDGSRKRRGEARDSNYLVRHVQLTGERMRKIEKLEAGRLTDATSIFITLTKSVSSNVKTYNYFKI